MFASDQIFTGKECLTFDIQITVGVITDGIVIIAAAVDRQIGRPIIRYPFIGDASPGFDTLYLIGTTSHRNIECGL